MLLKLIYLKLLKYFDPTKNNLWVNPFIFCKIRQKYIKYNTYP